MLVLNKMSSLDKVLQGSATKLHTKSRGPYFFGFEQRVLDIPDSDIISHVINSHLLPRVLTTDFGVPVYDIDLCDCRRISLKPVVEEVYRKLREHFPAYPSYRLMLVKTLRYIDERGLFEIDWDRVESIHPGALEVKVDIPKDCPGEERMGNL